MTLKEFTPATVDRRRATDTPYLSISIKSGIFAFNEAAVKLLKIAVGDHILFLQDEEDPLCWYVENVETSPKGFLAKQHKSITKGCIVNSLSLAREVSDCFKNKDQGIKFLIAGTPTVIGDDRKLYGLLSTPKI